MTGNSKEELISWIKTIVLAVLIALFINFVLIVNATVPTGSMENTIMTKDRVVALRMSYLFSDPERGDVVIFKYPDDETMLYVKRVIGLPGDTVEIKEAQSVRGLPAVQRGHGCKSVYRDGVAAVPPVSGQAE